MRIALAKVVDDIYRNRKTGLLSVTVKGGNNLFKMFFKEGEVYHIGCGSFKDFECLANLDTFEFSEYSFIPGIKLDRKKENVPPTAEVIQHLDVTAVTVASQYLKGEDTHTPSHPAGMDGFAPIRDRLKTALIRQIGPVGGKVLSKVVDSKWRASSTPTKEELIELVNLLRDEIDDTDNKNEFLKEAKTIIV